MRLFVYLLALITGLAISQPSQAGGVADAHAAVDAVESLQDTAANNSVMSNKDAIFAPQMTHPGITANILPALSLSAKIAADTPVARAERRIE